MDRALYAVIMAGGSGTRFWPASRRSRPKQFLPIAGEETLIARTAARIEPLIPRERILVVAGSEHAALVREALPWLAEENLLLEPRGRNTLPCVALVAAELQRRDPHSVQVVLPADHVIAPEEDFRTTLSAAAEEAGGENCLVTLGVRPTHPATGYGYIEVGPARPDRDGHSVFDVARFVEKPDRARAEEFLATGRFLWNSGVFVWSTAAIVEALERHARSTWDRLRDADVSSLVEAYDSIEAAPVDVEVLQRADNRRVLPLELTWSDVGSWAALPEVLPADASGNHVAPGTRVAALDSAGNVVHGSNDELVALIGVDDLVIVRSGAVTLVCPRDRAEDVRRIVSELDAGGREWT